MLCSNRSVDRSLGGVATICGGTSGASRTYSSATAFSLEIIPVILLPLCRHAERVPTRRLSRLLMVPLDAFGCLGVCSTMLL